MPEFLILILRRKYVIIKIKILSGNLRVFAIIENYSREKPVVWSQKSSASKPVLNLDPPQIFFFINEQNLMKSLTQILYW